jgi:hypothetical protein
VKRIVFALTVSALSFLGFAATVKTRKANAQIEAAAALAQEHAAQAAPNGPLATSACSFTFTSGANGSFLKYCVTVNGNITQLETPSGKEHIAVGAFGEGYGFCDLNPFVRYFDYADFGDSGNWGPATVLSQGAKSVKIARTTSDGIWTLTQAITQIAGPAPSIKIGMTLKNNSGVLRTVFLMRYADVDAGGAFQNNFDATSNSAFGWNSNAGNNAVGLVLQNAGSFPVEGTPGGFSQTVADGPDPCNFVTHFASGTQIAADGSIALLYGLNLSKGQSKTVTVSYRGL